MNVSLSSSTNASLTNAAPSPLARYLNRLPAIDTVQSIGTVTRAVGTIIESRGPAVSIGDICYLETSAERITMTTTTTTARMPLEVVGFRDATVLSMPLGGMPNVRAGDTVTASGARAEIKVGGELLGRVIDALGRPLDDKGALECTEVYPLNRPTTNPLARAPITEALATGVRVIDGLLTVGCGQRVGIFGGSGVGKSTLLGMMARHTAADVNVIALIGERGREVRELIENELDAEALARSVIVASTSDDSPLVRIRAALAATAIAEYFKDAGKAVLLIMDSVTRFCMAQREIGLAAGEPPSSKGYTPSVFAQLPKLLERAGNFSAAAGGGSITGFYTVLVEGDDMNEPIADAVRSILDGHIVLSRALAARNHYPCVDVLHSASRLFSTVADKDHRRAAAHLRELLAAYERAEDLINIGAYQKGSNTVIDEAIAHRNETLAYLTQDRDAEIDIKDSIHALTAFV